MPRRNRSIGGPLPGTNELVPAAQLSLQLADSLAGAMQLGTAVSVLRVILDTVQQVKSNKDSCLRLARRATAFVLNIRDTMDGKWDPAPPSLKESVDRFESLLLSIKDWMCDLAKTHMFTRFVKKDRIKDKITDFELQLIDTVSQFQNTVLVELQHIHEPDMHSQMIVGFKRGLRPQDDDGFPLVHRSDLVLHGMTPMGGGWWQNLAEASINGRQRKKDDLEFLKSVWDARFPQLYGVSQQTSANPEFIIIHNVGITDIRAFITPYLQQGHLLEVAAIATRIAEHLRAGLTMLASTGRWPAIYDQQEQPSLAMLSSLVVNNRGNLVIGGGHRIRSTAPESSRAVGVVMPRGKYSENGTQGRSLVWVKMTVPEGPANWPIKLLVLYCSPAPASPAQVSETLLVDLRDADWTTSILRELRASMASPDPASTKKTFVSVGNIGHVLGPLYAKILGEDEPFRKRRLTGHVFEGQFEEMHISEVMTDIVRFTFRNPTSISYQHQFSIHQKPKDDPSEKSARWQSIVANVARFARGSNITPDTMILSKWQLNHASRLLPELLCNKKVTGHRTSAVISSNFKYSEASPPPEVHFFLSYEDWTTSYWSYEAEYKPVGEREAITEPTVLPGTDMRGFYIQFIPEDFEVLPDDESALATTSTRQGDEKILDDRPEADRIPPVSLLYHGFGHVMDSFTHKGIHVDEVQHNLERRVDDFAVKMTAFYRNEELRRRTGLDALGDILGRELTVAAIGGVCTSGHHCGPHKAVTCVVKFKNELVDISSMPMIELTGYVARSHKESLDYQSGPLFKGWNVPSLGLTVIGPYITFYGIIFLGQCQWRLVPLTPMLSCVGSACEGNDRTALYAAFSGALTLLHHIDEDVQRYCLVPPILPHADRWFPYVSELPRYPTSAENTENEKLRFRILRHLAPDPPNHQLYIAKTLCDPEKKIVVKFTRRYSIELHAFCADREHAPSILGFGQVPGGWFVVAMDYISEAVYPSQSTDLVPSSPPPDTTTHLTISSSEDHPRAGLDGGGGSDEASGASPDITELTALEHFSSTLQSAQRRAAEAEGSRRKRARYTGQSEGTIGRQKRALRDLQAQGFHTLPDFFRHRAEKAMQKARIEAMVATATARLRYREEEEESSGTETAVDECSFKIVSEPGTTEGTLEAASNEKALGDSDRTGDNQ
ncbi:hypothetical protein EDB83DRAFT_2675115 [Lactarius deliciosus]|nr:hypothetical protein EDB83DRAFT_2675115 [Lactarius deliciosus]